MHADLLFQATGEHRGRRRCYLPPKPAKSDAPAASRQHDRLGFFDQVALELLATIGGQEQPQQKSCSWAGKAGSDLSFA